MLRIVTLIAFFFTATAVQAAGVATGGTAPVVAPAAPAAASAATCREVQVALPNIKTLPERVREYAAATKALRLVVSINATAGAITSEDMVACNDGLSVVPTGVPGEIAFSNAPGGGVNYKIRLPTGAWVGRAYSAWCVDETSPGSGKLETDAGKRFFVAFVAPRVESIAGTATSLVVILALDAKRDQKKPFGGCLGTRK